MASGCSNDSASDWVMVYRVENDHLCTISAGSNERQGGFLHKEVVAVYKRLPQSSQLQEMVQNSEGSVFDFFLAVQSVAYTVEV